MSDELLHQAICGLCKSMNISIFAEYADSAYMFYCGDCYAELRLTAGQLHSGNWHYPQWGHMHQLPLEVDGEVPTLQR